MDFWQAGQHLETGHKLHRSGWTRPDRYVYLETGTDCLRMHYLADDGGPGPGFTYYPVQADMRALDWAWSGTWRW